MGVASTALAIAAFALVAFGAAMGFGWFPAVGTFNFEVSITLGVIAAFAAVVLHHEDW